MLALRAWSLRVLAGDGSPPPPDVSAEAWSLFIATERCALPLRRALDAAEAAVPPPVAAAVTGELQRVLSAAAQLRLIGGMLGDRYGPIVVLKGGVLAADPAAAVDLVDVDVLLAPDRAAEAAAVLDRAGGYRPLGREFGVGAEGFSHLAQRAVPGAIQVELHYSVKGMPPAAELIARARPLANAPGLWRLAPEDHLLHLIRHSVHQHLDRRGTLRDLLLAAAAVRDCSPAALEAVRAALQAADRAGLAFLEMAEAIAAGTVPEDRFRAFAAGRLLLAHRMRNLRLAPSARRAATRTLFAMIAGRDEYAVVWRRSLGSPVGGVHGRSRELRAAARAAVTPLRAARLAVSSLALAPLALRALRAARD